MSRTNNYYRSILEMSERGWPGGIRWLHGEEQGRVALHLPDLGDGAGVCGHESFVDHPLAATDHPMDGVAELFNADLCEKLGPRKNTT